MAITRASAVGVPVNPYAGIAEVAHILDDSGARVLITDAGRLEILAETLAQRPHLLVVLTGLAVAEVPGLAAVPGLAEVPGLAAVPGPAAVGDLSSKPSVRWFADLTETEPATPARDDLGLDEVAWMLYTSGLAESGHEHVGRGEAAARRS